MNLLMNAADVRGLIRSLCDGDRCPVDSRKFWTVRHLSNLAAWADEKEVEERFDLFFFIQAAVEEYQAVGLGA
jgi:hypothetical protein